MDNEIKIESGIPIPESIRRDQKYPFKKLKIGQSFLFPKDIKRTQAQSSASYASIKLKIKLRIRITDEGIRCWRIA